MELREHAGPELQNVWLQEDRVIKPLEVVNIYYDYKTITLSPEISWQNQRLLFTKQGRLVMVQIWGVWMFEHESYEN